MRGDLCKYQNIKPTFSGHETFPLRYGWLKKVYDEVSKAESESMDAKDVFNNPESISAFGVGKNMVSSMRHWALYMGVIKENKITNSAKEMLADDGDDPWMENPTTLWRLHWTLVRNKNLVTYNWFFNNYNGGAFDRQFLNNEINELCVKKGWKTPSSITLKRDIECFIRMYVGKDLFDSSYSDESIESPLAELSLIKTVNKNGFFAPNRGGKVNLSVGMFLLSVATFWQESFTDESSLSFESLVYDEHSPGRIFLLDENSTMEIIYKASKEFNGKIHWSETAGMRQFTKPANTSLDEIVELAEKLIKVEYKADEAK